MNIMKIPPSPINRPQGNSIQSSSSNRTVQESTLRMGENRPKSINRSSTNNWHTFVHCNTDFEYYIMSVVNYFII
jgi:hypothetical protein